jgi:hypothetical protein
MRHVETPECERLSAISDKSNCIGEFIDWLHEQDMTIAKWEDLEDHDDPSLWPYSGSTTRLLAQFFDIDLDKVEKEKREILEALRETND